MEIIVIPAVIFRIYITSNPNIMTNHLPIVVLAAIALGLSVNDPAAGGKGYNSAQPFCAGSKFQTTGYNQIMLTNTYRTAVTAMPLPVAVMRHQLNFISLKPSLWA